VPLVIHEQNAVPGLTNQLLSRIASRVLEAFPGSFPLSRKAEVTGNPVRAEIVDLEAPGTRFNGRGERRNLLVLGGSQGAQILNQILPQAMAKLSPEQRPRIRHQAGRNKMDETLAAYQEMGVEAEVSAFLDDMAEAYGWADIVVCRSGALTISELAAAGVASVLVPFPHAVDDHQTRNAAYLVDGGAAVMLPQSDLNADVLAETLSGLLAELEKIRAMASSARALACPDAAIRVADICEEVAA
jgi:UDP-N-acetylglucosamine--N-acetylmuramyl-(pentapeptide) pyrophosphoryl-undecaprenol N-acetylglucosamine transferase